eukprot:2062376-Pleurochrysis_carterae.AAC.1
MQVCGAAPDMSAQAIGGGWDRDNDCYNQEAWRECSPEGKGNSCGGDYHIPAERALQKRGRASSQLTKLGKIRHDLKLEGSA